MSLWNKIKYLNLNIFITRGCKPLIFQTQITWSNRIHSLKYLRSATFGSKDIVIRKSEFVAKTQFLCVKLKLNSCKTLTVQQIRNSLVELHQVDRYIACCIANLLSLCGTRALDRPIIWDQYIAYCIARLVSLCGI